MDPDNGEITGTIDHLHTTGRAHVELPDVAIATTTHTDLTEYEETEESGWALPLSAVSSIYDSVRGIGELLFPTELYEERVDLDALEEEGWGVLDAGDLRQETHPFVQDRGRSAHQEGPRERSFSEPRRRPVEKAQAPKPSGRSRAVDSRVGTLMIPDYGSITDKTTGVAYALIPAALGALVKGVVRVGQHLFSRGGAKAVAKSGTEGVKKALQPPSSVVKAPVRPASSANAGVSKSSVPQLQRKINGNSKVYVGETHVYAIRDVDNNTVYKIGESMRGVNKWGLSRRAQLQVRKLERETGREFRSEIRRTFGTKAEARAQETRTIETTRKFFGADKLPGNKGVH